MLTRGYTFHTFEHGAHRSSTNYGICVKGAISNSASTDEPDFYGILNNIIQVQYPGVLGLKTILFKCNWYDTSRRGTRRARWGGIEINTGRAYSKNNEEPFILSTQADQVCFLPYPSTKRRRDNDQWHAVVKINPRGVVPTVEGVAQEIDAPMQEPNDEPVVQLQLDSDVVDRLGRDDIDGDSVTEADEMVYDAEGDDEFDERSNEDDNTPTDNFENNSDSN